MAEILYYLVKVLNNRDNLHAEINFASSKYTGIFFEDKNNGYLVPSIHLSKVKSIIGTENSGSVKILRAGTIDSKL